MQRPAALIATAIIALALAGCASASTGTTAVPNPAASSSLASARASQSSAAAAVQSAIASAAASPSSQMCTTSSCIVDDLQKSLVGSIAQDEAVATKVTCYKSTVKFHAAADTYTATCTVDYSDGSEATGHGNLVVSAQKVTFEPAG